MLSQNPAFLNVLAMGYSFKTSDHSGFHHWSVLHFLPSLPVPLAFSAPLDGHRRLVIRYLRLIYFTRNKSSPITSYYCIPRGIQFPDTPISVPSASLFTTVTQAGAQVGLGPSARIDRVCSVGACRKDLDLVERDSYPAFFSRERNGHFQVMP